LEGRGDDLVLEVGGDADVAQVDLDVLRIEELNPYDSVAGANLTGVRERCKLVDQQLRSAAASSAEHSDKQQNAPHARKGGRTCVR
jgi:hypothetical protein